MLKSKYKIISYRILTKKFEIINRWFLTPTISVTEKTLITDVNLIFFAWIYYNSPNFNRVKNYERLKFSYPFDPFIYFFGSIHKFLPVQKLFIQLLAILFCRKSINFTNFDRNNLRSKISGVHFFQEILVKEVGRLFSKMNVIYLLIKLIKELIKIWFKD